MQVKGRLRRVIRNGYERVLEVVADGSKIYWIGALAQEDGNPAAERFVEGSACDLHIQVLYVHSVLPQGPSAGPTLEQSIDQSPHCTITGTVCSLAGPFGFFCSIHENEPAVRVELERIHALSVGQRVAFAGELAVIDD
ncbi:hypothetical protein [Variovorax sp. UC122_21]|uniref:hypothetical protein n=1 Tax=Variovorax sp. UC122_21 TaxID=3374554 RepID=UPI003756369B